MYAQIIIFFGVSIKIHLSSNSKYSFQYLFHFQLNMLLQIHFSRECKSEALSTHILIITIVKHFIILQSRSYIDGALKAKAKKGKKML